MRTKETSKKRNPKKKAEHKLHVNTKLAKDLIRGPHFTNYTLLNIFKSCILDEALSA